MNRSLSYWDLVEGIVKGVIVSLIPGLHPLVFGRDDPYVLGVMYGVFTGMAVYLAGKGIFHAETAGGGSVRLKNILLGLGAGILLLPVAYLVYGVEIPRWALLLLLAVPTIILAKGAPIGFLFSSALGIVSLKMPVDVFSPLTSGLFYLFGLLYIFGNETKEVTGDWKGGVGASFLTGYFPALPPSAWSFLLGGGDVTVAAVLTPLFSLVSLVYGKTRSAMTAYIPFPSLETIFLVGASYVLSLLTALFFLEAVGVKKIVLPREVGLGVLVGHAIFFGPGNVLLLIASAATVLLSERKPSSLFGFIITPTLLYYA